MDALFLEGPSADMATSSETNQGFREPSNHKQNTCLLSATNKKSRSMPFSSEAPQSCKTMEQVNTGLQRVAEPTRMLNAQCLTKLPDLV
jgi:hypothetical protein